MKQIATAAFALCLMSGASAFADSNHDHGDHSGGEPRTGSAPQHGTPQVVTGHPSGTPHTSSLRVFTGHPSGSPNGLQGAPNGVTPQVRSYHFNGPTGSQTFEDRNVHHDNGAQNFDHSRGSQNGYHPTIGAPGFHPGGQRPRYSQQFFPHSWNPGNRFHWEGRRWFNPPGFYYRHWGYGEFWPFAWLGSEWYINDYWDYDLPVPPYGYEWVRNGPDALLVNLDTGMIVEVVPNLYY